MLSRPVQLDSAAHQRKKFLQASMPKFICSSAPFLVTAEDVEAVGPQSTSILGFASILSSATLGTRVLAKLD